MNFKIQNILNYLILLVCCLPLLCSLFDFKEIADGDRIAKHLALVVSVIPLLFISSFLFFRDSIKNRNLPFNYLDLFFLLFVVYVIVRGNGNGTLWLDEKFYWYSAACLSYFGFKILIPQKGFLRIVVFVLVGISLYQSALALLQLYGIKPTNFSGHITGTFFNPSLLGAFLACLFPFFLSINPKFNFNFKQHIFENLHISLAGLAMLFMLLAVPATMSRAAWIAVIVGTAYIAWINRYEYGVSKLKLGTSKLAKRLIPGLIIALLIAGLSGMYLLKKDSADGRILMWKVTARMWIEKPLIGHGFNAVNAQYLKHQADYFANGTRSETEEDLAGNVHWSFNELLQSGAELGFIGIMLFLSWLLSLLMLKPEPGPKRHLILGAKGAIIGLIFFSMFSYPLYSPPLFLLLIFFAALISSEHNESLSFKSTFGKVIVPTLLTLCTLAVSFWYIQTIKEKYNAYWLWDEANQLYNIGEYSSASESFEEALPVLQTNGKFLLNYGKNLEQAGEYKKAKEILTQTEKYWSDEVLYTTFGNVYKELNDPLMAEEYYQKAANVVPHKFYPHYLMLKLYQSSGEPKKLKEKADYIMNKKVKIHNRALEEIYEEVEEVMLKVQDESNDSHPQPLPIFIGTDAEWGYREPLFLK